MKRVLIFTLAIFLAAIFIPRNSSFETNHLKEHEMYLTDHEFHFLAVYDPSDNCFTRKIYSMIDQEYESFDIYLFVDDPNLSDITTYAKKQGKAHLIHIIEVDDQTPIYTVINETIKTFAPYSVVIQLGKNSLFTDAKILAYLNSIFKQAASPLALYSNFTSLPSFQQNKEAIDYESSSLKVRYAGDIPSTPYFLNTPLYIMHNGDKPQVY